MISNILIIMGINKQIETKNVEIQRNILRAMQLRGIDNPNQLAEKLKGKVTQPGLYMLLRNPEENNPTIKTLRAISKVLEIEPWMLLMPNFPFESIGGKPVCTVTHEGYRLLAVFESLPDDKRKAILDYTLFQINEAAPQQAKQIRDTRTHYKALPRPDNTYPTCNEDFDP